MENEVDEKTFCIDAADVLEKINKRTKAIIGVHLFVHPFDVKVMQEICDDSNLLLVEMVEFWAEKIVFECLKVNKPLNEIKICVKGG